MALDVVVGASAAVVGGTISGATVVGRQLGRFGAPVVRVVLRPPLVAPELQPASWLAALARRGGAQRETTVSDLNRLLDVLVPVVLAEVLNRVDLTGTVKQYVDLDSIVADVDLDAVAARLDVDAVAARLDIDAVIERLDLTALVHERVDINYLVGSVDLDAIIARVDIDTVASRVDVDAIIDRVDLVTIAQDVIGAIDLPEIIRESTGSIASETVRGVRMQGIAADEAVGRAVDRMLLRRGRRRTQAPGTTD